jgi:hypothetical protein
VTRPAARLAVAAGAVVVLLGGLGVVALRSSDTSTEFAEDAAVRAFRSASPVPPVTAAAATPLARASLAPQASPSAGTVRPTPVAAAPAPQPGAATRPPAPAGDPEVQPGVYRYATQGHEEVDALGGARHDYPEVTTVAYSRSGCGTEERWQPLEERIGVAVTCDGPQGSEVRETYQQREFFGQSQSKRYRCEPGVLVLPRDPRPGQRWSASCTSDDSTATFDVRVVGLEQLEVEGRPVPVVRVRLDGTLTGSTRGTSDRELWLSREQGLLVQALGETDTDADTAGGPVRYRESYRLRLLSTTPRR